MPKTEIIIPRATKNLLFNYAKQIKRAISNADSQTGRELITAAQVVYLKQRKTMNPAPSNSAIINSFRHERVEETDSSVHSRVVAGGATAPYAIYVEMGHRLRNGVWWEGYHFLDFDSSNWQVVGGFPSQYFRVRVNEIFTEHIKKELRV